MSVNPFVTPQGRGRGGTKTLWCCIIKWRQKLPLGLIWAEWAQIWILYFFSHIFHLSAVCGYWAVWSLSVLFCACVQVWPYTCAFAVYLLNGIEKLVWDSLSRTLTELQKGRGYLLTPNWPRLALKTSQRFINLPPHVASNFVVGIYFKAAFCKWLHNLHALFWVSDMEGYIM